MFKWISKKEKEKARELLDRALAMLDDEEGEEDEHFSNGSDTK